MKAGNKVFGSSASYLNCLFFNLFTRGFTSMMFFPNPLNSKVTTRTAALLTSQALSVFSTADKQLKIYQTKPDLHHELTKNEQVTMKQGRWRVFLTRGGGGAHKRVPEALTHGRVWRNPPPKKFLILKLRSATFII